MTYGSRVPDAEAPPGEYHILALGVALVVMLKGSGAASLDRFGAR